MSSAQHTGIRPACAFAPVLRAAYFFCADNRNEDLFYAYGISKCTLSAWSVAMANSHPKLSFSSITPGFIETSIGRGSFFEKKMYREHAAGERREPSPTPKTRRRRDPFSMLHPGPCRHPAFAVGMLRNEKKRPALAPPRAWGLASRRRRELCRFGIACSKSSRVTAISMARMPFARPSGPSEALESRHSLVCTRGQSSRWYSDSVFLLPF